MGRNLWIGPPGSLYEIDRAARSFDRSADLGVSEFTSLGGRVTVVRNARANRRTKLSWDTLEPAQARVLDRLARRTDGAGPVALLDPAAANMLDALQAAGRGEPGSTGLGQWLPVVGTGTGSVTEPASPGVFAFTAADTAAKVAWRHRYWGSHPVAPGTRISFRASTAIAALPTCAVNLDFKNAAGAYLSSVSANGAYVAGTVPAGAAFVTPCAKPGAAGTYALAGACLSYDDGAADGVPGDGCPAMAVTGYSDVPSQPLPYRGVSIDLVEVAGAAG
ncbi:hypothetical protein ABZ312_05450 [Streptomyces sp. NPDC006207]|nr:hypothetical protein [Streptomyces sp. PA03-5A]